MAREGAAKPLRWAVQCRATARDAWNFKEQVTCERFGGIGLQFGARREGTVESDEERAGAASRAKPASCVGILWRAEGVCFVEGRRRRRDVLGADGAHPRMMPMGRSPVQAGPPSSVTPSNQSASVQPRIERLRRPRWCGLRLERNTCGYRVTPRWPASPAPYRPSRSRGWTCCRVLRPVRRRRRAPDLRRC